MTNELYIYIFRRLGIANQDGSFSSHQGTFQSTPNVRNFVNRNSNLRTNNFNTNSQGFGSTNVNNRNSVRNLQNSGLSFRTTRNFVEQPGFGSNVDRFRSEQRTGNLRGFNNKLVADNRNFRTVGRVDGINTHFGGDVRNSQGFDTFGQRTGTQRHLTNDQRFTNNFDNSGDNFSSRNLDNRFGRQQFSDLDTPRFQQQTASRLNIEQRGNRQRLRSLNSVRTAGEDNADKHSELYHTSTLNSGAAGRVASHIFRA